MSCGNVTSEGPPHLVNQEPMTGFVITTVDNRKLGEYGNPSKGGDADGKNPRDIHCIQIEQDQDHDDDEFWEVPVEFRFDHPYPNPVDEVFTITLSIPCDMDVEIWAVIPPEKDQYIGSVLGHAAYIVEKGRVLWSFEGELVTGSIPTRSIILTIPAGFCGSMLKAEGYWPGGMLAILTTHA